MKKESIFAILLVLAAFTFTGCETVMSNMTGKQIAQNPSNIYTLRFKANLKDANVIRTSLKPSITIDGKTFPMRETDEGFDVFAYDYVMPNDRNIAKYYYTVKYRVDNNGMVHERMMQSPLYELELMNRYVISMQSNRGLVGSTIPVAGRGFRADDQVTVGDKPAPTTYTSANQIAFVVPPLPAGETYPVRVRSGKNVMDIGDFHVDSSVLGVNVEDIDIQSGEKTLLVFQIDSDAMGDGLDIDVSTDIPNSIIMPETRIPSGARSVSVMLEGGEPGEGSLFVSAAGYGEVILPVNVGKTL